MIFDFYKPRMNKKTILTLASCCAIWASNAQVEPLKDYPLTEKLNSYRSFKLTTDLSKLTEDEKKALVYLIKAAKVADDIYWMQTGANKKELLDNCKNEELKKYISLNYGPWDRLNDDKPFVEGVGKKPDGAGFYPVDITKQENDSLNPFFKSNPYSVIVRTGNGSLNELVYSEIYKDKITEMASYMRKAAEYFLRTYPPMHAYLTRRAMALENNNYNESDAIWLTLKNSSLDLIIGPIENYEDKLNGTRTAFEAYVLVRDKEWGERLEKYVGMLPELQKNLPVTADYKPELSGGSNSQLAVFDAVYYAGDCNAGSKTIAVNLPNDEELQKTMGTRRTQIRNVMQAKFDNIVFPISGQVIDKSQQKFINFNAFFNNVMFHEVAHGLGIKNLVKEPTKTVREGLGASYSAIEECKADVLGLWMVTQLVDKKELPGQLDEYYVTFVASVFRSVRFGAASAHGKANMITFNTLLSKGAITRSSAGTYKVDVAKMKTIIAELAGELLVLQGDGNKTKVDEVLATRAIVPTDLKMDLEKIGKAGIPIDIYFEQGIDVLGLKD